MSNEQRVQNKKSPYYGKRHDELPLLPSPPIPVVRNKESMYYGMTLKKAQRLHRKLYPHPPPPPEPEGCHMYRVKYRKVKDSERITDPVEWAKGTVENLAKWLCKTGLLKPAGKREQQHPRRPYKHVAIGERWYSVRLPCKPGEQVMVDQLVELGTAVRRFAGRYGKNQCAVAVWDAFEIGTLIERVEVLQYDSEVGTGRKNLANYVAMRQASAEKRRTTPEKTQGIIAAHLSKKSYEQIARDVKVSRSTVARTLKRYRQTIRKK